MMLKTTPSAVGKKKKRDTCINIHNIYVICVEINEAVVVGASSKG